MIQSLLKTYMSSLRSRNFSERLKAAEGIGELGPKAKPARRALCEAMLDPNQRVRTAAADALKRVDPEMAELAISIYVNFSVEAIGKAGQLKEDGEPLTPLVLEFAKQLATGTRGPRDVGRGAGPPLPTCLVTLANIARQDEEANRLMIGLITFQNARYHAFWGPYEPVHHAAIVAVRDMKNAKRALAPLLVAARTDSETNRLEAIRSLEAIYDENNDKAIRQVLESMRFDKSEAIRKAVEDFMQRLKEK
ncbi:MAG TPA: hypothetical protein VJ739_14325 [Gemmataceae bacterium]|nr:hypothetical protein [Gemmataceae bacterium]